MQERTRKAVASACRNLSLSSSSLSGTLSKDDDYDSEKVGKKNEFAFFQT